jgi:D-alanyl-D-alanine carboxypeptidase (penicillin-binding protein 5/6)
LLEVGSGQVLTAEKPDERIEPASLTKLMTAYLTFAALRQKTITSSTTPVTVSQKAWKTGGSKMFIQRRHASPGRRPDQGHDRPVGATTPASRWPRRSPAARKASHQMMNREAKRLGMNSHQLCTNSTGLPDPQLYTTARDLATLASALIRDFPEEYRSATTR